MDTKPLTGSRILVTGGAGFIGSELTRQLCEAGAIVTVVDNLVNGKRDNLADIPRDRYQFSETDVQDEDSLTCMLKGVDIVYHLACLGVRHSIHSPYENHLVNADATLRLLKLCDRLNVGRFVCVSTSEVYGTARWIPMTEAHPTFPMTVYGASKLAGEHYTRAYYETYDYPTVVIRPFNSYGPRCHHEGDSGEIIPRFMLQCMAGRPMTIFGDGSQTRDYTYVSDTARGIMKAGLVDEAIGETINIGQGDETSVNDLSVTIGRILDIKDPPTLNDAPRPGDILRLWADTSKARDILDFTPTVSLHEGLSRLRDWYLNSGKSISGLLSEIQIHNWKHQEQSTYA